MRTIILLISVVVLISCNSSQKKQEEQVKKEPVKVENKLDLEVYDFNGFEKFLNKKDGKIYVINFWATWCAPCVKELPYFEKLKELYKDKGVEILLVSLDFPNQYDSKLKPFIIDKKITSKVIALDDVDMNTWIPKVNENWSGALPATIIYKNDESKFFEQSFTYEILENEVKQFLK
ncbi:redoxin domain-containing protein [Wenyingzhuangia sp. chi5]|uniref:Redoxin domain-containing protein n=1 Tax=Wenyingzhuangia gilva TaxID=3057677 RepID=A0ABT8VMW2_9FLAO|nr:redoxin domain-containing protein [Wenyingzhuangia sp. chi5]MDO3693302.1 redoxin domain-containing protein [Wenyingzhuangia sp. chi5]